MTTKSATPVALTRRRFLLSSLAATGIALTGCSSGAQTVEDTGTHLDGSTESGMKYQMFLPPGYDTSSETRYSVLLQLHGATTSWVALRQDVEAIAATATAAAEARIVDPMIIVAPHDAGGWSMWADSHDGSTNIASQIVNELIPEIDSTYRTWPVPECRVVTGFSMGGFGAATLLFKFPELFGAGVVWDGAMHDWASLQTNRPNIASQHFANSQAAFDSWSPWTTAALPDRQQQPLMMVRGAMDDFYDDYTRHLTNHAHTPVLVDAPCGHDMVCQQRPQVVRPWNSWPKSRPKTPTRAVGAASILTLEAPQPRMPASSPCERNDPSATLSSSSVEIGSGQGVGVVDRCRTGRR